MTVYRAGALGQGRPRYGRQAIIALTAKGAGLRKKASDEKRTWLAQAVARLDRQDRRTLFAAGEIIRRLAESDGR